MEECNILKPRTKIVVRYEEHIIGLKAIAVLNGEPEGPVSGTIKIVEPFDGGPCTITGEVNNLRPPGKHGFHIHEFGDQTLGCDSTGGHFNPFEQNHGGPEDAVRHLGDLGNIVAGKDGTATVDFSNDAIRITSENSIVGHSMVVTACEDDLGRGVNTRSVVDGRSGNGLACGVIGHAGLEIEYIRIEEEVPCDSDSEDEMETSVDYVRSWDPSRKTSAQTDLDVFVSAENLQVDSPESDGKKDKSDGKIPDMLVSDVRRTSEMATSTTDMAKNDRRTSEMATSTTDMVAKEAKSTKGAETSPMEEAKSTKEAETSPIDEAKSRKGAETSPMEVVTAAKSTEQMEVEEKNEK